MSKDKLAICPRCGSDACYEQELGADYKIHQCYGCGFTTNTLMTEDSKFLNEQVEVLPELYKDLMHIDENDRAWFPATITLPGKGMVFADGTDKKNWRWAAIKAKVLTEEEIKSGKYPKDQTHKMDMQNMTHFDANKGFMDALEIIGFYEVN